MEEWHVAFDAEQKKHFCEQENSGKYSGINHSTLQPYWITSRFHSEENSKGQKHDVNDNNLDSDMYEPDAIHYNRDALASNRDGQGS
eukprot:10709055-Ditylum_brightwellii.AAC.1